MNSVIYDRLLNLFKNLGISVLDKSIQKAEIKGYAAGIELADKIMNDTYLNMFIDTANDTGLSMYLNLIDRKSEKTTEETRNAIITAFSDTKGFLKTGEFEKAIFDLGSSCDYTVENGVLLISSSEVFNKEFLEKISYFFKNYAPVLFKMEFDGNGIPFDNWEALNINWYKFDSYNLPFSVIDTLKIN